MAQKRRVSMYMLSLLLLCSVLLSSCGGGQQQEKPTEEVPPAPLYAVTENGVVAFDANNGNFLWEFEQSLPLGRKSSIYAPVFKSKITMAAVLDQRLFIVGEKALYALNTENGEQIWEQPLQLETSGAVLQPTVFVSEELVFVTVKGFIYAFDIETGTLRWRSENSTMIFASEDLLFAQVNEGGELSLVSFDISSGERQWSKKFSDFFTENISNRTIFAQLSGYTLIVGFNDVRTVPDPEAEEGDEEAVLGQDGVLALDVTSGDLLWDIETDAPDKTLEIREATVVEGSLYLAGTLVDNALESYDIEEGKRLWAVENADFEVNVQAASENTYSNNLSFTTTGIYAISGPLNGDIQARGLVDGTLLWTLLGTGTFDALQIYQDTIFAVSLEDETLTAFNADEQQQLWVAPTEEAFTIYKGIPYVNFDRMFSALDPATGTPRWSVELSLSNIIGMIG